MDTPGIHEPLHKLGEYMVKVAINALQEVDVVLFLVEAGRWTKLEDRIVEYLNKVDSPIILGINKSDLVTVEELSEFQKEIESKLAFNQIISFSAINQCNLDVLVSSIVKLLPEGPKYYPDDWVVDHPERFIVAEFIREQILLNTHQEIPHSVAVDVDEMVNDETKDLVRIRATIYLERDSQKGIVIGKQGRMLKTIGTGARHQIEALLGTQVYLDLWVKVNKDWRNSLDVKVWDMSRTP